jgi:hypothetical protein
MVLASYFWLGKTHPPTPYRFRSSLWTAAAFSSPSRDFTLRRNGNSVKAESQGVVRSSCPYRNLTSIAVNTKGHRDAKEVEWLRMTIISLAVVGESTPFGNRKWLSIYAESCTAKAHNHEH